MELTTTRTQLAGFAPVSGSTAVVMTMGALHAGHAQLIDVARGYAGNNGRVVVSIFVNPRQFGEGEDFDRYPRSLDADLDLCRAHDVDIVFAPGVAEVYPEADDPASGITIAPGPLGEILEGASRPGHFTGVLTVVSTLMHLTRADICLYGEKDYQQLVLIRAMTRALGFPVRVVGVPTVREADGLALSSRNSYLSPAARSLAAAIPAALNVGAQAATESGADAAVAAVRTSLAGAGLTPEYVAITDLELRSPPVQGPGRLLVAVPVEGTRLIDNIAVDIGGSP